MTGGPWALEIKEMGYQSEKPKTKRYKAFFSARCRIESNTWKAASNQALPGRDPVIRTASRRSLVSSLPEKSRDGFGRRVHLRARKHEILPSRAGAS
ncbi:hypothetical protein H6P81_005299 [Aristolochia fimbriata]|uniref:Uncharacterized protein n=1 Tax=Aristolochia fimbriata TaxID=158543 RepID=A0AAV7EW99_ARIFI|nr:hypothetical protein H6P81_005299 [Aristolochia fimbriata]